MSEKAADKRKRDVSLEKADALALLETANSASERVAGLHVAFMAICVYVLVIVFGTTDLDLLMGKGVKLPVVNVDVPIVGFYAFAPFIIVLVHFNLLLQLQLLSRKLFAFDAAAPQQEGIGGMRDRLHIFPYTYYLVGRPSPIVLPLVGVMVSITLVLLPFITLLALQLWFLAYQSEAVTWSQRIAIWLDVSMVFILWPIIMHPQDDWHGYWLDLISVLVPRRRVWLAFFFLFTGLVFLLLGAGKDIPSLASSILLLVSLLSVIPLRGWKTTSRTFKRYIAILIAATILATILSVFLDEGNSRISILSPPLLLIPFALLWQPTAPRGSLALLFTLLMGLLMPLALLVDGESLERLVVRAQGVPHTHTSFSEMFLFDKRRLDLIGQVLLAKPPKPETLALIRSGKWKEALNQIEPINLRNRSLRHALIEDVILIGADLKKAQLQGVWASGAQLQGANLESAQLQGANLQDAQLQETNLSFANLRGANLQDAQLPRYEPSLLERLLQLSEGSDSR